MRLLAHVGIFAALGCLAATPLATEFATGIGDKWLQSEFFVDALVLPCPPHEIMWGVMTVPKSFSLALKLTTLVVLLNGLIYAPAGFVSYWVRSYRSNWRFLAVVLVLALNLVFWHWAFAPFPWFD